MRRRHFLYGAGATLVAAPTIWSRPVRPEVSITIDDFHTSQTPLLTVAERHARILDFLSKKKLQATAFVIGRNAESDSSKAALKEWAARGHTIGNHSYSHKYYPNVDFDFYSADVLSAERVLSPLPRYSKIFRFPFLKEGDTVEKRDRMREFLDKNGYRNGHVTIDASDWYVDGRLRKRLEANPKADVAPYRDYYLSHIWERAQYYDSLSRETLGRSVKHTLLIHFNLLNALFLGDMLAMFEAKGWKLVNSDDAFRDPVFSSVPNILPAGESIIWALAKGKGNKTLRYPAEDGQYEKDRMDARGL